jgi:RNA polymerase sigma-B factor
LTSHPRQPATEDPTSPTLRSLQWLETEELWPRRHASHAREELVRRFLPLARRLATRYRSTNEPLDDLVQVASLGLLRAIDRFDPEYGTPFPSYAIPTILGELRRHFRDTGWAVRVPRGLQELALSIENVSREMTERLGRSPRVEELAQCLDRDIEDILDALQASNAHYGTSLDATVVTDPDAPTLGETLGDEDDSYPLIDTKLDLAKGISKLPYLERRALDLRLRHDLKQTEIAQQLGCSQMQVSRLLTRAARRLREP